MTPDGKPDAGAAAASAVEELAREYERRGLYELAAQLRSEAGTVLIVPPAAAEVQRRLFEEFLRRQAGKDG